MNQLGMMFLNGLVATYQSVEYVKALCYAILGVGVASLGIQVFTLVRLLRKKG